jgi:hypothetical protein
MIRHTCLGCGKTADLPDNARGRKATCPRCRRVSVVGGRRDDEEGPFLLGDTNEPSSPADEPIIRRRRGDSGNGLIALILGVLALVLCPPLGLGAIIMGNKALREDRDDARAKVGIVLGCLAVVLLIVMLGLVGFVLLLQLWRFRN